MQMYIVYKDPKDYPGKFVVRRWHVAEEALLADNDALLVTESWEAVCDFKEVNYPYLIVVPRHRHDDLAVKEVWL